MAEPGELVLGGCRPEPLIAYLKALGVFRLLAEQADSDARAYWSGEEFRLVTALAEAELVRFFLQEYSPTPLLAPWNGGSGFYPKDASRAIGAILGSGTPRFDPYRTAIREVRALLDESKVSAKPAGEAKVEMLRACRRKLPDPLVRWLDVAFVLSQGNPRFPPVLGTGANDGRFEFTNNFMHRLAEALPVDGTVPDESPRWLEAALFGRPAGRLVSAPVGQFHPGGVGGPNATEGFKGGFLVNPWDFILMMEGTLLFAGSVIRRFDGKAEGLGKAAFPFTAEASPAGWSSVADAETAKSRGELWVPLWGRPARLREIEHLFAEGRAEVGRRRARDGLDFARAAVLLGVDRGIVAFRRYGLFARSGKSYLAAPLGEISVGNRPEGDVLTEADAWIARLRRAAAARGAPASLVSAHRRVADAMFEFCLRGGPRRLQDVLVALGSAERSVSRAPGLQRRVRRPLHDLSSRWAYRADDATPEFRLAAALGSIRHPDLGDIRVNLEPVALHRTGYRWTDRAPSVVWSERDLTRNLAQILHRRIVDAHSGGSPVAGRVPAALADIDQFLRGGTDDDRLGDLLWGLATVRWTSDVPSWRMPDPPPTLSRPYALLKLLHVPSLHWGGAEVVPSPEPEALLRLRRGDVSGACRVAARRLRSSGFVPMTDEFAASRAEAGRILAALLFPVSQSDALRLAHLVLRPPAEEVARS